jgi:hypothetical protein
MEVSPKTLREVEFREKRLGGRPSLAITSHVLALIFTNRAAIGWLIGSPVHWRELDTTRLTDKSDHRFPPARYLRREPVDAY